MENINSPHISENESSGYIPFKIIIIGSEYPKTREILDKEILSQLTKKNIDSVVKTIDGNLIMLEFFIGAEILMIDPSLWNFYAKALEMSENMKYVTSNSIIKKFILKNKLPIVKHPNCNIWMSDINFPIDEIINEIEKISLSNVFSLPKNGNYFSLYDEVIKSYEYKIINEDENNIYLHGNEVFNEQFLYYALEEVSYGNIPIISVHFDRRNIPVEKWKASFTEAYIKVIQEYAYYIPETINILDIGNNDILSFLCHKKSVYEDLLKIREDPENYYVEEIKNEDVVSARYALSEQNIRSFIVKTNIKTYLCTKEPQKYDIKKYIDEKDIDTVIGDSGKIYPRENYLKEDDTFNKYKIYIGYNSFGYYTYGPLKGIVDNPIYQPFTNFLDEYVAVEKNINENEYTFKAVHSGRNDLLIGKIYTNDPKLIKKQLTLLLQYGYFYSYWTKSYMQTFLNFSNSPLIIPSMFKNGDYLNSQLYLPNIN